MSEVALRALPSSIPREALTPLLDDVRNRAVILWKRWRLAWPGVKVGNIPTGKTPLNGATP